MREKLKCNQSPADSIVHCPLVNLCESVFSIVMQSIGHKMSKNSYPTKNGFILVTIPKAVRLLIRFCEYLTFFHAWEQRHFSVRWIISLVFFFVQPAKNTIFETNFCSVVRWARVWLQINDKKLYLNRIYAKLRHDIQVENYYRIHVREELMLCTKRRKKTPRGRKTNDHIICFISNGFTVQKCPIYSLN